MTSLDAERMEVREHCWEAGPYTADEVPTVCVLPDGHIGPHEFTRGDEVIIRFPSYD